MVHRLLTILLSYAVLMHVVCYAQTAETVTQPLTLPSQGVVLLNTGYIFEGMLSDEGTHLAVKTAYGSIRLAKANIERVAGQRSDIYCEKLQRLAPNDAAALLRLGEWCLQNEMRTEAEAAWTQGLAVASEPTLAERLRVRIDSLRISEILSATTTENVADNTTETAALRQWAATVPQAVRESFMRKVQPILMAKCASAECHGSDTTSGFRLANSRTEPNAALLNLRAALGQIDLIDPLSSPIVAEPSRQHAGVASLFSRQQQSQLSELVRWADVAAVQVPKAVFDQLVYDTQSNPVTRTLHSQKNGSATVSSWSLCAGMPSPTPATPAKRFEANDPFDPAIFNMMYHAEQRLR